MTEPFTKTVSYSKTEQVHLVSPADLNGNGRLFGGTLLKMIDEVAAIVAKRHTGSDSVTTAAIDNLTFKAGAYVDNLLVLIGYVTYTGNTSLEVRVDTYVEDPVSGIRRPINRAYLVMVLLDEAGHPARVPQLVLETEAEKGEWEMAELRRAKRLEKP
ncbi:MAG: acyl-CoA thioesterase [Lachnospiraceae bacterium]|nr:acyl-CoA thioesterase [Lachnospiraceae bacterium]